MWDPQKMHCGLTLYSYVFILSLLRLSLFKQRSLHLSLDQEWGLGEDKNTGLILFESAGTPEWETRYSQQTSMSD